jgi:hypothetical protein
MKKAVSTSIIKVIFVVSVVLAMTSSGYCNESFYKNHARGWHWYERNKENEEVIVTKEQNSKPSAITAVMVQRNGE